MGILTAVRCAVGELFIAAGSVLKGVCEPARDEEAEDREEALSTYSVEVTERGRAMLVQPFPPPPRTTMPEGPLPGSLAHRFEQARRRV
jgi:hypothetical protein